MTVQVQVLPAYQQHCPAVAEKGVADWRSRDLICSSKQACRLSNHVCIFLLFQRELVSLAPNRDAFAAFSIPERGKPQRNPGKGGLCCLSLSRVLKATMCLFSIFAANLLQEALVAQHSRKHEA